MPAAPKQPQDRRPPARKQTATSEKRRKAVLDESMVIKVDDVEYELVPADMTGRIERRVRLETGMSVQDIGETLERSPGIDILAAFMWAVRLSRGEDVDYDDVLDSVSYASEVEVLETPEVDRPEA